MVSLFFGIVDLSTILSFATYSITFRMMPQRRVSLEQFEVLKLECFINTRPRISYVNQNVFMIT